MREPKRIEVLRFIDEYHERVGWAPTVREIASGVGLSSTSSVHSHLIVLADEGLLKVGKRSSPRALAVTSTGRARLHATSTERIAG